MTMYEYLRGLRDDVPTWLDQFKRGDAFSHQAFFGSRVVYYPGSGTDGHPVKVFGSTHSAHHFVYADYGVTQETVEAELRNHGFQGYHTLSRLQLRESDLTPRGWTPHVHAGELLPKRAAFGVVAAAPFGFLEVLERDHDLDDSHGARRLAVLFLGADGIAAYDALFCQGHSDLPPFAVLLHDHGFGGNYDRFGQAGLLERIARQSRVLPPWLLVAENTQAWQCYGRVRGVAGDRGGMHATRRFLYVKQEC